MAHKKFGKICFFEKKNIEISIKLLAGGNRVFSPLFLPPYPFHLTTKPPSLPLYPAAVHASCKTSLRGSGGQEVSIYKRMKNNTLHKMNAFDSIWKKNTIKEKKSNEGCSFANY